MQYSGGCKYGGGLSAVPWGGGGGYHAVQWRVRSTVEGYHQYSGGCKYGGGLSCSTVEGYHSVRWKVRSTVEGYENSIYQT